MTGVSQTASDFTRTESLNERWRLRHSSNGMAMDVQVPFDVHSSLIETGNLNNPYWRDEELRSDWVHESEWLATREFEWLGDGSKETAILRLSGVDCVVTVRVNGKPVGSLDNAFVTHQLDVTHYLVVGTNLLELCFHSNSEAGADRARNFPFEIPYQTGNNRIGHVNFLRKTQCDAGWDWNIALMPIGVYGNIELHSSQRYRVDDLKLVQHHHANSSSVEVDVTVYLDVYKPCDVQATFALCGQLQEVSVSLFPGVNEIGCRILLEEPELWWPVGHGDQILHTLTVCVDDLEINKNVGIRHIQLHTESESESESDAVGEGFAFSVNGRKMFMRGANWIPQDALPARSNKQASQELLQSAVDAHFNMIRVWGGGRYEADWFYSLCDELGLLVWQDFMFSCNHYPAADSTWLNSVRREAAEQIKRLSLHPSIAVLCGDNELVGALTWFEVTRNNRDRYLANYVMLNHALEEEIEKAAIDVPFWPSSPSSGRLNFGDAWHDDRSGDMHFWDVWHEAKSFEHYRSVKPRFCSEFGFQSFPSMPCIERFTEEDDRNVSSPVMDVHQRNDGGNARIVETISRYFRFPNSFEKTVFLSQVAQGLAMQTAVEWWRANKPHTMGTLYWQLNDTWPVASWASIEHGGAWKVTHYLARKFYCPVMLTAQPDEATGDVILYAVSDVPEGASIRAEYALMDFQGNATGRQSLSADVLYDASVEVGRISAGEFSNNTFLSFKWQDDSGTYTESSSYFKHRFKEYDLPQATITSRWVKAEEGDGVALELTTDLPAFFVTVGLGEPWIFSDNAFTLLPGEPRQIRVNRCVGGACALPTLSSATPTVQHLAGPDWPA